MEQLNLKQTTNAGRASIITRERVAISLLFLMNGFTFGNWAPRIPAFAESLGLDSAAMGLLLLVFGIGSLTLMPVAGALSVKNGTGVVLRFAAILVVPALLLVSLVPNVVLAVAAMFYLGGTLAAMDVTMNANAVGVEKSMRRAIMSSCHAFWSLGVAIGAAIAGPLMSLWGPVGHGVFVTLVGLVLLIAAWPAVMPDISRQENGEKSKLSWPKSPLPWLVGVMALFCMVPEGAILDWSSYHMQQDLGIDAARAGVGFAAFSAAMAIMRFAGDLIRDRLGAVLTMRICGAIAIAGLLIVGLTGNFYLAVLGFGLCGIGISNLVPIAFSMAGNLPGILPSVGLSIVTTLGYSGMLVAPSVIGFVAKYSGFGVVFASLPILLLVVLVFSGYARYADHH